MKKIFNTKVILIIIICILVCLEIFSINGFRTTYAIINNTTNVTKAIKIKEEKVTDVNKNSNTEISITAVGDCTIGYDNNFGYHNSFNEILDNNGYDYFFNNVIDIFKQDDISLINLEGTFTNNEIKTPKKFNFKGPENYAKVLTSGSIELTNIANNHTLDYGERGFIDTINTLENNNINYYGYDNYYIYSKNNIKIGFGGIYCIENKSCTSNIDNAIKNLKANNVNIIILSFHWGIERNYVKTPIQEYLAHYAIDNGVELVIGHHPHVLEGIELYKDKYIVYSLGNFIFGGNKNPSDKDSMIFNIKYEFDSTNLINTVINVYPTRLSSVTDKNDYKPTLLEGTEKDRVIKKIENLSNIKIS